MKTGIIDVGGGLRGIYGAGVLDRCMEEGVQFDCCIGVSAGSANMSSYVAGQHGRNKPFYQDYSFRKEYMSVGNLVRKHSYLDLEYVYGALRTRWITPLWCAARQSWSSWPRKPALASRAILPKRTCGRTITAR